MRLQPPIPPNDPNDWTGWWRPWVAPDAVLAITALIWATFIADGTKPVLLIAAIALTVAFSSIPINAAGALAGVLAAGVTAFLRAGETPPLERGVLLQDWPPEVLHNIVHRFMDPCVAALAACALISLITGVLIGHCPRSIRNRRRRHRLDQDQRRRIARGLPPRVVPGDALWGVPYDTVPIERPDHEPHT